VWQISPETSCRSHTNVSKFAAVWCELICETWTTTFLELCHEQWIVDCSSVLFYLLKRLKHWNWSVSFVFGIENTLCVFACGINMNTVWFCKCMLLIWLHSVCVCASINMTTLCLCLCILLIWICYPFYVTLHNPGLIIHILITVAHVTNVRCSLSAGHRVHHLFASHIQFDW
jgi:hypothetical protein